MFSQFIQIIGVGQIQGHTTTCIMANILSFFYLFLFFCLFCIFLFFFYFLPFLSFFNLFYLLLSFIFYGQYLQLLYSFLVSLCPCVLVAIVGEQPTSWSRSSILKQTILEKLYTWNRIFKFCVAFFTILIWCYSYFQKSKWIKNLNSNYV